DRLQEVMLYFDFLFHLACYLAPLRDRFLKDKGRSLLPYQLPIIAMINVKISVPVYKRDEWGQFDRKSNVEIAADAETFSEAYSFLRVQVDELLQQSGAENTLLLNLSGLEKQISNKERTLQHLNKKIEIATNQLQRLQIFLQRLGIDPDSYSLFIADKLIDSGVAVEAEVDPIPFDSAEYDDDDDSREF
ncbi:MULTISPECIES: hypothetical protein, partial [unclassified Microcoleus]